MIRSGLLLLVITAAYFFQACKEHTAEPPLAVPVEHNPITSISGKIENWTYGAGKSVKIVAPAGTPAWGTAVVDQQGNFVMSALLTPPASALYPVLDVSLTVHFSNLNAKQSSATFGIYSGDTALSYLLEKSLIQNDKKLTVGDFSVEYVYSDQNTSLTGYHEFIRTGEIGPEPIGLDRVNYALDFKTGWNKMVTRATQIIDSTHAVFTVDDQEPSGGTFKHGTFMPSIRIFHGKNAILR